MKSRAESTAWVAAACLLALTLGAALGTARHVALQPAPRTVPAIFGTAAARGHVPKETGLVPSAPQLLPLSSRHVFWTRDAHWHVSVVAVTSVHPAVGWKASIIEKRRSTRLCSSANSNG